jgi:anti-anti-sigma factor
MPIEQWSDKIWLVQLDEEPGLSEDLLHVKDKASAAATMPDIVLDFSGVDHVNSSNLSQLLRIRKETIDRNSKLKITGLSDTLWAIFLTTGLDKIFDFAANVPTALAGLQIDE